MSLDDDEFEPVVSCLSSPKKLMCHSWEASMGVVSTSSVMDMTSEPLLDGSWSSLLQGGQNPFLFCHYHKFIFTKVNKNGNSSASFAEIKQPTRNSSKVTDKIFNSICNCFVILKF